MLIIILQFLALSLCINMALFVIAYLLQTDKLTDISYALSFFCITAISFLLSPVMTPYGLLLFLLVTIWAIRLGGFLLVRVRDAGKDTRFDAIRSDFLKFGRFWFGQAITVWVVMIPVIFAQYNSGRLTLLAVFAALLWFVGLTIEATADYQKFRFRRQENKLHPWISTGLWKYARHPNYFGEILIWSSVYLYSFTALSGYQKIIGIISPLFITILLRFVSGVPLLEKSNDKQWGDQKAYATYKDQTNLIVPLRLYKHPQSGGPH